jgi:hypothetical protein
MAASDANLLIVSATHGSALGICTGAAFQYIANLVAVRGEGVTGPTSRGMDRSDFQATISYLVGPPRPVNGSPASLVIVVKKMDGSTSVTYTITTMKASSYSYNFNRDSAPAEWSQTFEHVGDMASDPQSQA